MTKQPMGLGKLGSTDIKFTTKIRWTFNLTEGDKHHEAFFIKLNHRPSERVDFLNQKPPELKGYSEEEKKRLANHVVSFSFIHDAGKYDPKSPPPPPQEPVATLYRWIREVCNFKEGDETAELKREWDHWGGVLNLYDGCGNLLERWTMPRIKPLSINFGDLEYSSSSELTIEVTLLYDVVEKMIQSEKDRNKPSR